MPSGAFSAKLLYSFTFYDIWLIESYNSLSFSFHFCGKLETHVELYNSQKTHERGRSSLFRTPLQKNYFKLKLRLRLGLD